MKLKRKHGPLTCPARVSCRAFDRILKQQKTGATKPLLYIYKEYSLESTKNSNFRLLEDTKTASLLIPDIFYITYQTLLLQ